jgi:16S rRNA processing protein RimM
MEDAQKMRGKTVEVYRCDVSLDLIFAAELIGCAVFAEGKEIGKITDVLDYPGNKVYVVKGEYEYMIPAVKAFVLKTDVDAGVVEVRLLEGMGTHES